jgi:hypothetical protein
MQRGCNAPADGFLFGFQTTHPQFPSLGRPDKSHTRVTGLEQAKLDVRKLSTQRPTYGHTGCKIPKLQWAGM